jgi:hypothetical protein
LSCWKLQLLSNDFTLLSRSNVCIFKLQTYSGSILISVNPYKELYFTYDEVFLNYSKFNEEVT